MGKDEIEGVVRVDPSKHPYSGRISVYKDGDCLGVIDPITLDSLRELEKSGGKTIKFKPISIRRESGIKLYRVNKFSIE